MIKITFAGSALLFSPSHSRPSAGSPVRRRLGRDHGEANRQLVRPIWQWLSLIGIVLMAVSGQRLGYKVGADWEFAGFASGILWVFGCAVLPMKQRLAQLEKRIADLMAAKADR